MSMTINKLTEDQAKKIYASRWWETSTHQQITEFQLFTDRFCVPFDVFHEAIEKSLRRPVWTHEFGLAMEDLRKEFLGERPTPSIQEIMNLIPEDKRVVVVTSNES